MMQEDAHHAAELKSDGAIDDVADVSPPAENSPPVAAAPRPGLASRFGRLFWALAVLALVVSAPMIAERIQYAITRGHQRARSDLARAQLTSLQDTSGAFRLVAQSIGPAVVHVEAQREPDVSSEEDDDFFGGLFGRSRPIRRGQGSGVIVDVEGYLITNYHVIEKSDRIRVNLSDGRRIRNVRVVGVDPLTDLAVLKINAGALTAVPWGESEQLEVGDWVMAIGNPFGLDRTVTAGIVSAKHRGADLPRSHFQDFLQTDAAVNPGNSGGPLVNLQGQLVGINTAIVGETFQGVSFAVPSEIALDVYQRLRAEGKVARGWLGVRPQEIPSAVSETKIGAWIGQVIDGSPAQRAGLRFGDVILRWDDQPVDDPQSLRTLVAGSEIGVAVPVVVLREGQQINFDVQVDERPNQ